ncbi:MAG: phage baseplate assembly protein V [Holosporaceae bacterium]|jgi:phage baseplate assembly protein gpV|nr:phage baseplate assembly protein V [Holosporaceae bacterium]
MNDSFAFSDLFRRVANLIRIGKICEIDGARVKAQIGNVKTNWLPIISTAGDTNVWIPITVGESVAIISPFGEMSQSFVVRSLHYNRYAVPENSNDISLKTKSDVKAESEGKFEGEFKNGLELKVNDTYIYVHDDGAKIKCKNAEISVTNDRISCKTENSSIISRNDQITLNAGNASITLSSDRIRLSCRGSTIDLSDSSISLNSPEISTIPSVCKCQGGL